MRSYKANQHVDSGVYFCVRRLAFRSMEEAGPLKGAAGDVYRRVPALAMLFVGPLLGLLFLIFLPFVGIVMAARVAIGNIRAHYAEAAETQQQLRAGIPIHVRRHTRIHAPLDKAYAMARDPEHWSDWYVGPDEATAQPFLCGYQDTAWMPFPLCEGIVDERVGATRAHWRSESDVPVMAMARGADRKGLILSGVQDWTWEAIDGETEVTVEVGFEIPEGSLPQGASPETLQKLEAAGLERSLDNLKHYCEHLN
jgi:hypothetical protein